mmetsp:Transcript_69177/g.144470  ORF Transcript_69177/g.144470 Transcript_69177/m.144470 type:complete len:454 (-) Transcript_69177:442-1803(-)
MSSNQVQYDEVALLQSEETVLPSTSKARTWGRTAAVSAVLLGTAAVASYAATSTVTSGARTQGPSVPLLEGESLEAFENLRQLMDPDVRIHAETSPTGKIIFNDKDLYDVQCSVDVLQSAAYLGQAVISIEKTLVYTDAVCKEDHSHTSGCATQIELAVVVLCWLASYLSLAASSCAEATNVEANCAADVTGIAACLAEAVLVGTLLSIDCKFESKKFMPPFHPRLLKTLEGHKDLHRLTANETGGIPISTEGLMEDNMGRRLKDFQSFAKPEAMQGLVSQLKRKHKMQTGEDYNTETSMPEKLKELVTEWKDRQQEKLEASLDHAQCGMDAMQSVGYLIRSIKIILGTWNDGCVDGEVCAINILNIIACFSWMAQFTAALATDCTLTYNQRGMCAADTSEMVAVVTCLAAYFIVIDVDCEASTPGNDVSQTKVVALEQGKRRLAMAEEEEEA